MSWRRIKRERLEKGVKAMMAVLPSGRRRIGALVGTFSGWMVHSIYRKHGIPVRTRRKPTKRRRRRLAELVWIVPDSFDVGASHRFSFRHFGMAAHRLPTFWHRAEAAARAVRYAAVGKRLGMIWVGACGPQTCASQFEAFLPMLTGDTLVAVLDTRKRACGALVEALVAANWKAVIIGHAAVLTQHKEII